MFMHPYETTPCSSYVLKDIVSALQHALANGELRPAKTLKNHVVEDIYEVPPYGKAVPPFSHPISFSHHKGTAWALDTRAFVRELRTGDQKIVNPTEYQFLLLRGMMTKRWAEGESSEFLSVADLPARVFIRLLSEGIVRRLGLSPMDQQTLVVVTGFYFFSTFYPEVKFEEDELLKIATRITRLTAVPVTRVLEILDPLPKPKDVYDYCNLLKTAVGSSRLDKFTPGLLYAIVGGCWYGAAAREVVAVSLEYPPTFFAMLYMALTDRSYRTAYFTKMVISVDKGGAGKSFLTAMTRYLEADTHV